MHSSTKEERENPWWKKILSDDQEKKAIAVIDRTEELKRSAFEKSIWDEKGEEITTLNKEKSS